MYKEKNREKNKENRKKPAGVNFAGFFILLLFQFLLLLKKN